MILILCALTLLLYLPSFRGCFLADDQTFLDAEELFGYYTKHAYTGKRPSLWWGFFTYPRTMTGVVNTWIWRGFGFNPAAWHGVNVLLHVFNVALVYRLVEGYAPGWALGTAAGFAVHPLQVSAVSYLSARSGVQCATFAYTGLLALQMGNPLGAIACQFLAQKSKEDAFQYLPFWGVILWLS